MSSTKSIIYIIFFSFVLPNKVFVALQMFDQVAIINTDNFQNIEYIDINLNITQNCIDFSDEMSCNMVSNCEWSMNMCMESTDSCMELVHEMSCNMAPNCEWSMGMCMESGDGMSMGNNTPHFIAVDETNGYWFVSAIASGFIGRYSLDNNELIDKIFVDDSPAILTLDEQNKKIYCSRMMPMGSMMIGSESTIVQQIDYSGEMMISTNEFVIPSSAPHGISINSTGTEVFVASNTADWIYKIIPETGEILGVVMDSDINNPADIDTQRLKPIQCLSVADSLLFITCSGGIQYDSWSGISNYIPGQVQLWNSNTMTLLDSFEYEWYSTPWHIINSPNDEKVYVVLAGDQLYNGSSGVSELSYSGLEFSEIWFSTDEIFETLHGIDISDDGEKIYISGRGDGHLHEISTVDGVIETSIPLSTDPSMVMAGGVATMKTSIVSAGDINGDLIIDILDIILGINIILGNFEPTLVQLNALDYNQDSIVNVLDIIEIIDIILE